jgi:sugar lactone lactonase YvrE
MTALQVERFYPAGGVLSEGPLARRDGTVAWVDIKRHEVHEWRPGGIHRVHVADEAVSALAETTAGDLLAATPAGLRKVVVGEPWPLSAPLPARAPDLRMNDGKADPAGRFVGGTMSDGDEPRPGAGALWSFDAGTARKLVTAVTVSNGLAWSQDGATLYFIDTPTRRVDAFDYDLDTGDVSNRRTVIALPEGTGDPDGMCIDDEGGLWVALWGGGAVHRYDGTRLDAVVDIPTPYVTCPAFVGPHGEDLVVTTASEPFGDDAPEGAGDLYVVRPGVRGPAPACVDLERVASRSDR